MTVGCFLISLGFSIWLFCQMNLKAIWAILLLAVMLLMAYRIEWFKGFSMRNHPATKGPAIALCWCCITVWLPVTAQQVGLLSQSVVALTVLNVSLLWSLSWLCDITDLHRDHEEGLITFPVYFGVRKTLWLSIVLAVGGSVSAVILTGMDLRVLGSAALTITVVGLSVLAVTRLNSWPAKWMVDTLLLSKPVMMIVCMS